MTERIENGGEEEPFPRNTYREKPFNRGGLQSDGTLIHMISQRTLKEHKFDYHPPEPGNIVSTKRGLYEITQIIEVMTIRGKQKLHYFHAVGRLVSDIEE